MTVMTQANAGDSSRPSTLSARALPVAILRSAADAIVSKSLDGRVTSWNAGAERLYGYRRAEILGQSFSRIVPPERAGELPALLERLRRGENVPAFDTVRVRQDGASVHVSATVSPVRDGAGAVIGMSEVSRDIATRREAAEDARRIMASARAMIWHADVVQLGEGFDWHTRLSNEEAGERLWPVAVPAGLSYTSAWYMARLADDSARINENSTQAIRGGQSQYAQEFRIRLADGSVRWLAEDVQIERVGESHWRLVGVCTDVTERKREQEALRDVMTSARCLVWSAVVERPGEELDWDFQVFNPEAAQRLWPVAVGPGQTYAAAWATSPLPEDQPRMDKTCHDALFSGQRHYRQEYRVRLADGAVRWVGEEVQIDDQGRGRWVLVGVCTDITERKAAEVVLAAAHDRDRRIAETWQHSLLHQSPGDVFPGLSVQTFYEAALEEFLVGGDFFDAFALDARRVALVVGDVTGKGLLAAAHTAEVKYALRAFLHAYADPGAALSHLNDLLCATQSQFGIGEVTLVVLSLAVVDRISGEAVIAVAGAEPPLVLRAAGAADMVETGGRLLGVESGADYPIRTLRLESGDTLLMATDGITEARRGHTFLGVEGLAALAGEAGVTAPLREVCETILHGARAFAGGPLRDDVCLLLARHL